jgi:hypothetical protein
VTNGVNKVIAVDDEGLFAVTEVPELVAGLCAEEVVEDLAATRTEDLVDKCVEARREALHELPNLNPSLSIHSA